MKLRIIDAVIKDGGSDETCLPYLRQKLRPDTEVTFERVEYGFPSVESELHGMVNGSEIVRLVKKAEEEGADGVFINCFDDPGVYASRELVCIPVFGAYQPAVLTAMSLADRVGIITTDRAGIISEERKARINGFDRRIHAVRAVDMGVLSLAKNPDALVERLAVTCVEMYENDQIGALTLGCTGMHFAIEGLRAKLRAAKCPVTVIEPLQNGVAYLEHIVMQKYTNALHVVTDIDSWKKR